MRRDIYRRGDQVEFDPEYHSADMVADLIGGRFGILDIIPVNRHFGSVGHTQWLVIDVDRTNKQFSGAFFKKIRAAS